jgi:hypothetical protein
MSQIDLTTMARFLVLPGAPRLLEAFAAIPPGRLRDTVIAHAEALAEAHTAAPAAMQMPDPLLTAAQTAPEPVRELPNALRTPMTSEEEIVALRLHGRNLRAIVEKTGRPRQEVDEVIAAARAAGVAFPAVTVKPEQGASFITRQEDLSGAGRKAMEKAAFSRGLSLDQWLDARALFVEMRLANRPIDEILAAVPKAINEKTLMGWLYLARSAGIDLPLFLDYTDAEVTPVKSRVSRNPRQITVYRYPVFTPLNQLPRGTLEGMAKWAAKRGLTTQQMFDLREKVVEMRLAGESPSIIADILKQDTHFVRNAAANAARDRGVVFPPARQLKRDEFVAVPKKMEDNNVVQLRRWFGEVTDLQRGARSAVEKAAQVRNMTVQAYLDLCESIVRHRMAGLRAFEIADLTGEKQFMVKDIIAKASERGAVFPPYNAMAYADVRKAAAHG